MSSYLRLPTHHKVPTRDDFPVFAWTPRIVRELWMRDAGEEEKNEMRRADVLFVMFCLCRDMDGGTPPKKRREFLERERQFLLNADADAWAAMERYCDDADHVDWSAANRSILLEAVWRAPGWQFPYKYC